MANMNKSNLKKFKKMLQDRLSELLNEVDQTTKDISRTERETFADPTDQAVVELDRTRYLRFKDRERKLIRKIEKALSRIEEGTYGECEACGSDIEMARLEARPMTELCIDCATEAEGEKKKSKLYGTEAGANPVANLM